MPLQIIGFKGAMFDAFNGGDQPVVSGNPVSISANTLTGSYTVPAGVTLIKIKGVGTITWSGVSGAEDFDGIEWRGVNPGDTFTVA